MGEGGSEDPFDSSIDASWLGAAPTAEDAYGNPIQDSGTASDGAVSTGSPSDEPGADAAGDPVQVTTRFTRVSEEPAGQGSRREAGPGARMPDGKSGSLAPWPGRTFPDRRPDRPVGVLLRPGTRVGGR